MAAFDTTTSTSTNNITFGTSPVQRRINSIHIGLTNIFENSSCYQLYKNVILGDVGECLFKRSTRYGFKISFDNNINPDKPYLFVCHELNEIVVYPCTTNIDQKVNNINLLIGKLKYIKVENTFTIRDIIDEILDANSKSIHDIMMDVKKIIEERNLKNIRTVIVPNNDWFEILNENKNVSIVIHKVDMDICMPYAVSIYDRNIKKYAKPEHAYFLNVLDVWDEIQKIFTDYDTQKTAAYTKTISTSTSTSTSTNTSTNSTNTTTFNQESCNVRRTTFKLITNENKDIEDKLKECGCKKIIYINGAYCFRFEKDMTVFMVKKILFAKKLILKVC
jgi:hypothetical protein